MAELGRARPALFWLFLGGFCWVLGDLFQNYATKYVGIARGIPLSNTNQLWGLAWGVLVFGELAGQATWAGKKSVQAGCSRRPIPGSGMAGSRSRTTLRMVAAISFGGRVGGIPTRPDHERCFRVSIPARSGRTPPLSDLH
jgi:hypothetical protein